MKVFESFMTLFCIYSVYLLQMGIVDCDQTLVTKLTKIECSKSLEHCKEIGCRIYPISRKTSQLSAFCDTKGVYPHGHINLNILSKNSKNIYADLVNVTRDYCEMVSGDENSVLGLLFKIVTAIDPSLMHTCPLQGIVGPKNVSLQSSFLDDFPKFILPSKNMRVDVGYFTRDFQPIFTFRIYVSMEAGRRTSKT